MQYSRVCSTSLLKTLREKEKLLVTSNFSFSHSVFYPCHFHQIQNCRLQTLSFWKSLKFIIRERVKKKVIPSSINHFFNTYSTELTHSLIHHFETVPNSWKLQMTTEMWLLKDFKIQIAWNTLWKKVKLLKMSNFTFFPQCFPTAFFLNMLK